MKAMEGGEAFCICRAFHMSCHNEILAALKFYAFLHNEILANSCKSIYPHIAVGGTEVEQNVVYQGCNPPHLPGSNPIEISVVYF